MLSGKIMITHLKAGLTKRHNIYMLNEMNKYFPKPYEPLDLSSLKADVGKIDIDELKTVPADLCKLSNVIANDVIKKTVCNKLVTNANSNWSMINTIDTKVPSTSKLISETQCNSEKQNIKENIEDFNNKIPNTSSLVKKTYWLIKTQHLQRFNKKYIVLLV